MQRTITDEVIEIVTALPGISSGQIIDMMPHVNRQSIYSTLNAQFVRGILTREKLSGGLGFKWSINPDPAQNPPIQTRKAVKVSDSSHVVDALRQRIAELEAWKDNAIRRYPDLAVSETMLKARKIVADELRMSGDVTKAEQVLAGRSDGSLAVRLVVKML